MQEKCDIVSPYDIGSTPKQTNIVSLNYTNQDFYSMKSRLVGFIKEKFGNDFNDFVESNLAIMLIENFSFLADTLSFKIDQIANELFIDTVTELDNAFRLAKLTGLRPQPPIGSKALFSVKTNSIQSFDIKINTPYEIDVVSNQTPLTFELYAADPLNRPIFDEPIIIRAGQLINSNIVGIAGKTKSFSYNSTGSINLTLIIPSFSIISDSIRVVINGQEWQQVDYFTSGLANKEYLVEYNPDYSANVIFGNGNGGLVPPVGSKIEVLYRVGGGPNGDVVTNFINGETLIPVEGQPTSISVFFTNYTKGEFGYSGDTVEDIREKIPLYLRTQNRTVSGEDYKNFANQFATSYNGIMGKATAALRSYGCAANIIDLFILIRSGENRLIKANSQFKEELTNSIDEIKMLTDVICIRDGEIVDANILVDVTMDKYYKKFEDDIRSNIEINIEVFFNLNNWDYGQSLQETDIIQAISNVKQVRNIDVTFNTVEVPSGKIITVKYYEIIRPESITVNFLYN
jgi:hypothetical protein